MRHASIALLTDFGTRDAYVGMVKGVLARLAPDALPIDLTHAIPPGDVRSAAFTLWQAQPYLPPASVVLAIVDPGVGTARGAIAVRLPHGFGVGPDNGLFSWILNPQEAVQAVDLDPVRLAPLGCSATFHGRDLFAPAAAQLASGVPLEALGPARDRLVRLAPPRLEPVDGGVRGEVLWIDNFGNAITSLGRVRLSGDQLEFNPCWREMPSRTFPRAEARLTLPSGVRLPLARTFGDVPAGEPLAYLGSSGLLEIGIHAGHAESELALSPGQTVTLAFEG